MGDHDQPLNVPTTPPLDADDDDDNTTQSLDSMVRALTASSMRLNAVLNRHAEADAQRRAAAASELAELRAALVENQSATTDQINGLAVATRTIADAVAAIGGAAAASAGSSPAPPSGRTGTGTGGKPIPAYAFNSLPAGAWCNNPQHKGFPVDQDNYRLPGSASKPLAYHDIMKAEASALQVLGNNKLVYNRKYSESYNHRTFMLALSTNFKREVSEFETAEDITQFFCLSARC